MISSFISVDWVQNYQGNAVWHLDCIESYSMDSLSISAASGIRSRMESLDLLANNLANASTSGFKADREFYSLYVSSEAIDPVTNQPTTAPLIERHWTDFSQGLL